MPVLELVREVAGAALAVLGLLFIGGGALGVLRFPDVYTRTHAAASADGVGAVLTVLGLAVLAGDFALTSRLVLIAVLLGALAPFQAHAVASAAHAGGLSPLSGSYVAPRPGRATGHNP